MAKLITADGDILFTVGDVSGDLVFSDDVAIEGSLLVGTDATLTAGAAKLEVDGDIYAAGDITTNGGSLSLNDSVVDILSLTRTTAGGGAAILFENGDGEQARMWIDSAQQLKFDIGGTIVTDTKMTLTSTGALLIGTDATLTAAAAKLEVDGKLYGSGTVRFDGLPTSDPGVVGELWRSGADLKISI